MLLGFDPQNAFTFWLWVARLWPMLLVGGFLFVFRASLRNRLAFGLLGLLVCFGVQFLVGQISVGLPVAVSEHSESGVQIVEAVLENLMRTVVIASVISIGPLWWLCNLLRSRPNA
jgi:hypothetical protein